MRLVWLVLVVLALVPETFGWRWTPGNCCGDSCTCGTAEVPSCCKKTEGPVIVALCGCGGSHAPTVVQRAHFDWFAERVDSSEVLALPAERVEPAPEELPSGNVVAPEPPPPRSAA